MIHSPVTYRLDHDTSMNNQLGSSSYLHLGELGRHDGDEEVEPEDDRQNEVSCEEDVVDESEDGIVPERLSHRLPSHGKECPIQRQH